MATNKELIEQVKILKAEVRKLRSESKTVEAEIEELNHEAFGVFVEDKVFKLAKIKYDPETNKAALEDVKTVGNSIIMASSAAKKAVVDTIIEINKRRA